MSAIKRSVADGVGTLGAYRLARALAGSAPRILVYHRFGPRGVSVARFEQQVRLLKRNFDVLPLSRLCDALERDGRAPPNAAVITVDDGYEDFYRLALPVLRRYELPATVYVVSDFVDRKIWLWPDIIDYIVHRTTEREYRVVLGGAERRYPLTQAHQRRQAWNDLADYCLALRNRDKWRFLRRLAAELGVVVPEAPPRRFASLTWRQIREMQAAGIEIGSHTCTHPRLTMVEPDELERELGGSKARIEEMIGREVASFCYPNGSRADYDENIKRRVQACGYRSATVGFHDHGVADDIYALRRYGAGNDMYSFRLAANGVEYLRARWRARR